MIQMSERVREVSQIIPNARELIGITAPDMTMALDRIVPESMPWLHTDEGPEYV
ncbi:hypothetical protein FRC07_000178 [Ceratobasidium sp. 392]|nr:hypothetical protein FRC07_000178 [Ceratobasidium sp. 392]